MNEKTHVGLDKIERYGWSVKDEQGILEYLDKNLLKVDPAYQRDANTAKVRALASNWSWLACGAILVAMRRNDYFVFDGQHRVLAAKSRSDIKKLPCIVFVIDNMEQEATAFLDVNAGRSSVPALGKYRALLATNDKAALFVQDTFDRFGIRLTKNAKTKNEFRGIAWCLKKAREDEDKFCFVFTLAYQICDEDMYIPEKLLHGLWYLESKLPLTDKRLLDRIKGIGGDKLTKAGTKACGYYGNSSPSTIALGMLDEINKGLKNRFEF